MQQVQRDDFTKAGPELSQAARLAEAGRDTALRGGAMLAILVVVIAVFGLDAHGDMYKLLPAWLVLVYGLINLVGGLMAARKHGREAARLTREAA